MRAPPLLAVLPLVAAALLAGARARAAEPIEIDRFDVFESRLALVPGRFRLEYGVSATTRLRAASGDGARATAGAAPTDSLRRTHGVEDVAFGARWRVREGDAGGLPGVAWLADVETPIGSRPLHGAGFRPSVRATAEWELPHEWTVGVMPGLLIDRDEHGKRYGAGILAVTLGKAWTPRWRTFVELAAQAQAGADDGGAAVTLDTGLALRTSDSLQFDLAVSRGVTSGAPDFQAGLGLSARF